MKRKKFLPLLAVLTAGSLLLLGGCSFDATTINEEDVPLEVEVEQQGLSTGTVTVHSVWYDAEGDKLTGARVEIYNGESMVFAGSTDADGSLPTCPMPYNTELVVRVTGSDGGLLAETELVVKVSDEYEILSVYPTESDRSEEGRLSCLIEAPADKTDIRAAAFITGDGNVSFANLTPYVD